MVLGTVLVVAALFLFIWNQRENNEAGMFAKKILSQVIEQIEMSGAAKETERETGYPNPYDSAMTEVEIDGYAYIGYLSVPVLELELPVMSEWDYDRLKTAPCRYAGSTKTDDLVICAHNYSRHFGTIHNLSVGDAVYFTDMDGKIWKYEVTAVDLLAPTDVENMTAGEDELTLFTCTYSGGSRVTVRCQRTENESIQERCGKWAEENIYGEFLEWYYSTH